VKNKIKKIFFSVVLALAMMFPKLGLIHFEKTAQEMEDDGEVFLGV